MDGIKRCRCANCHQPLRADPRNAWHQRYCQAPACRAASKAASQRRWLDKPENRDYFRGAEHVQRVRVWREAHPGYAGRERSPAPPGAAAAASTPSSAAPVAAPPLQDLVPIQVLVAQAEFDLVRVPQTALAAPEAPAPAPLQDLLQQQPIVLIGLLAHLSASTLQDDIALAGRRLLRTRWSACMTIKRILCEPRLRRIPAQFSWVDPRLVRISANVTGDFGGAAPIARAGRRAAPAHRRVTTCCPSRWRR